MDIYEILTRLQQQGKTIIVIEHDTDYLQRFANKILLLDQGAVLAYEDKNTVFRNHTLLTKLGLKVPKD
jgi:energy-coupling factor transporter ATP-binding protein EcfA2